jgi:hypothetical protein
VSVREHGILFQDDMVRAILDGRKTMTRRVVKPQPYWNDIFKCWSWYPNKQTWLKIGAEQVNLYCPYGQAGDRLWVRETFTPHLCCGMDSEEIHYRADGESCPVDGRTIKRWYPSIHMPRWASRITLEVIGVKVERVQDISEEDAKAEGICCSDCVPGVPAPDYCGCRSLFANLWDSINAKRGYGWAVNPWVWSISFRRVK